jgi:L-fucose isomerase-like protein
MKINIFPIVSSLHEKSRINEQTQILLDELIKSSNHEFNVVDIDELYNADLSLILIQSGGSEGLFLENFDKLKEPFYLLTYGHNNSLAASLEILSYIKDHNLNGEVLHGDTLYLSNRINELLDKKDRLGVIGKPSDWLIASNVNYSDALKFHNIELVDIDIEKVLEYYNDPYENLNLEFNYDKEETDKAIRLHQTILKIKDEYKLDGLTIRCFALLDKLNTTACLSLAMLNKDKVIGTCEGDIPTMISMHVLNKVTGQPGFQANPSRIDVKNSKMVLAHCTLPLDMVSEYELDTHFESGIGVAVRGKLKEEVITIFKLSRNLKDYYVSTGRIIRNLSEDNLCRSQIEIEVDNNIEYFLTRPYGNHHVIVYGDHRAKIKEYMDKMVK